MRNVKKSLGLVLKHPSKHFLFSQTSSRRLEGVFSVTLFVFQDVLKTSSRRLQDVFAIRLPKTSSRRLARRLQDVFKTSSRLLQYVFTKKNVCWDMTHLDMNSFQISSWCLNKTNWKKINNVNVCLANWILLLLAEFSECQVLMISAKNTDSLGITDTI